MGLPQDVWQQGTPQPPELAGHKEGCHKSLRKEESEPSIPTPAQDQGSCVQVGEMTFSLTHPCSQWDLWPRFRSHLSLDKRGWGFQRQESQSSIKPNRAQLGNSPKDCELSVLCLFLWKCNGCWLQWSGSCKWRQQCKKPSSHLLAFFQQPTKGESRCSQGLCRPLFEECHRTSKRQIEGLS